MKRTWHRMIPLALFLAAVALASVVAHLDIRAHSAAVELV